MYKENKTVDCTLHEIQNFHDIYLLQELKKQIKKNKSAFLFFSKNLNGF